MIIKVKETIIMDGNIILRKMQKEDLDFLVAEQERPENSENVPQWSKKKHLEAIIDPDFLYLMIEAVSDFRPLGYVIFSGLKSYNNDIYIRQIVITEKRKGYGRATLILIKNFVFNDLKAHKIHFEVWTYNSNAINLYKSEDFFEEGIIRDCAMRNHRYLSYIVMSMLEDEYYAQNRR